MAEQFQEAIAAPGDLELLLAFPGPLPGLAPGVHQALHQLLQVLQKLACLTPLLRLAHALWERLHQRRMIKSLLQCAVHH